MNLSFLSLLQGTPLYVVLIVFLIIGLYAIWRHSAKMDIDSLKSIGELQNEQISNLQNLVKGLTEQLSDARSEIAEISRQNQELRIHVMKLEAMLIANGLTPPNPTKVI